MSKQQHDPPVQSFLRKFRFEILALFLFGGGIFLLLEKLEIKQVLFRKSKWALSAFQEVASYPVRLISQIQQSDIVGLVLVALSIWILGSRIRFRMIQRHRVLDIDSQCTKCNSALMRIHRSLIHKLLEVVFRVRITCYCCQKCALEATVWVGRNQP